MRGDITPPKRAVDGRPSPRPITVPSNEPINGETPLVQSHDKPLASTQLPPPQPIPTEATHVSAPRSSKKWIIAGVILVIALIIALCGMLWYNFQLSPVDASSTEKIKITIEPGSDLSSITSSLQQNGLIRDETAFGIYVRLNGKGSALQSGSYRLSKSEPVSAIVKHLTSGNTDTFSVTFLPGATLAKHRQVMIDAGYEPTIVDAALNKTYDHPALATKPDGADLEGYIYGETYNFPTESTPEQIITRALDQLQSVIESNGLEDAYKKQGFTLYEGITMASIIQREVATPEDAAQVAQVFKLRYDRGMQLGSDVTYQYIADKTGQQRSVDLDSPYNTRRYAGLPPGPISSPGEEILLAVGKPAAGDFVYFLSGDDDKTYFARTNEEHEKNIRNYCQKKCQII